MLWNDKRPGAGLTEHTTGQPATWGGFTPPAAPSGPIAKPTWGGPAPADFAAVSAKGRSYGAGLRANQAMERGHTWGGHYVAGGPASGRHILGVEHFGR